MFMLFLGFGGSGESGDGDFFTGGRLAEPFCVVLVAASVCCWECCCCGSVGDGGNGDLAACWFWNTVPLTKISNVPDARSNLDLDPNSLYGAVSMAVAERGYISGYESGQQKSQRGQTACCAASHCGSSSECVERSRFFD